ncbi:acetylcholine receptor subunit alpha-type acr-16 [Anabrus simplex]|uniref:acetylcholine receptor subunit alpha-type acr-16 n=1 Tax=Anabrus simplex TaxID=316456 RepID=UPI0034DD7DD3
MAPVILHQLILLQLLSLVFGYTTLHDSSAQPPWNFTWVDQLKKHLFTNYDKHSRPTNGSSNTTVVKFGISVQHVDFDELKSIMTVNAYIRMSWYDEKLQWNASEFGGLSKVHVGAYEIWRPDIALYNSATGSMVDHYASTHCLVYNDGSTLCVPPSLMIVFCTLDLRYWPFDTQNCNLEMGSWTYSGDQLDLQPRFTGELDMLVSNTEWEIQELADSRNERLHPCCPEPFIDNTFNLKVRRKSSAYSAIIITPTTVIVLLTLAIFWLPPQAGEKLIISSFTAIIICFFLLYFSQKLPAIAGRTPLVVLFYIASLHLVGISIIVSVTVLNLSRYKHSSPLPWFVKNALTGRLGHILGLGHIIVARSALEPNLVGAHQDDLPERHFEDHTGSRNDDSHMIATSQSQAPAQNDWILLAIAIDRIAFLLYCFLFVIFALAFSI